MNLHYHVMENGRKGAQIAGAEEAERALRDRVASMVLEKQHQGEPAQVAPVPSGGLVVTWGDRYLHGRVMAEVTGCLVDHAVEAGPEEPLMGARAEVFAFAASEDGIWHLPGIYPLQSGPVPVRLGIRPAADALVEGAGAAGNLALMHGTSDRDEDGCLIATHGAVVDCPDPLDHWPHAVPVAWSLFAEVDQPPPHAPVEAPAEIRYIDVLLHSLRHLAYHQATDSDGRAAMPALMAQHLSLLRPELFRRYERGDLRVA